MSSCPTGRASDRTGGATAMSDSSNPAPDEIVSLTSAYRTAVVVFEDGDQDILVVRADRTATAVAPRSGACRACDCAKGTIPSRPPPASARASPATGRHGCSP